MPYGKLDIYRQSGIEESCGNLIDIDFIHEEFILFSRQTFSRVFIHISSQGNRYG